MLELQAQKRIKLGKQAERLFSEGFIPAEIYGRGFENVHIKVPTKEFMGVFKDAGESSIIQVKLDDQTYPALIYGVQWDQLGDKIIHIDLYKVNMDEKITTMVPLVFVGEAPAIKAKGGVLIKALEEIEIEALPKDLPHQIEVQLGSLIDIHQSIHIKDLPIPTGVEVLLEDEMVVATISEQQKEEEQPQPTEVVEAEEAKEKEGEEKPQPEEKK